MFQRRRQTIERSNAQYWHILIYVGVLLIGACQNNPYNETNLSLQKEPSRVVQTNIELGTAYLNTGKFEEALATLKKAKQADPNYSTTYEILGLLYQRLGQNDLAMQHFRKALSLDPNNYNAVNNYGQFLCANGHQEEAEKMFLRAIDNPLYKRKEIAISNAGTCAFKNGQSDKAEVFFRRALHINPRIAPVLIQMAEISYNNDQHLSARAYLERYHELAQYTANSLWLGIQIEDALGDKDTMASYALRLRNDFPDTEQANILLKSGLR